MLKLGAGVTASPFVRPLGVIHASFYADWPHCDAVSIVLSYHRTSIVLFLLARAPPHVTRPLLSCLSPIAIDLLRSSDRDLPVTRDFHIRSFDGAARAESCTVETVISFRHLVSSSVFVVSSSRHLVISNPRDPHLGLGPSLSPYREFCYSYLFPFTISS